MSCLIDTNVWIRYFAKDDLRQFEECDRFFDQVEMGSVAPYVSNVTLMEILYTLKSYYGFSKEKIAHYLKTIMGTRNLVILEKTNSRLAFEKTIKVGVKYTDCLIAGQLKRNMVLVSFDRDFDRLVPGIRKEPGDLVK
ncbi:hypothetical protein A2572_02645 [Candidatus Collierbacteria bacterium RIFOXYD1_FULL_40_9]|uniref:PIN domain-containing protein n=1 Tax=Candidatus Collierbacteria bacterium RIFOXYD1_FULL_40_9 TaxID=1817731 RepID=A0A1F5FW56_9BACT|nr:MAG: hypothetical protein A2572_02645 [Candidatus Collierbacteria bacterium RIFOXYD1_FULL_40_9]